MTSGSLKEITAEVLIYSCDRIKIQLLNTEIQQQRKIPGSQIVKHFIGAKQVKKNMKEQTEVEHMCEESGPK